MQLEGFCDPLAAIFRCDSISGLIEGIMPMITKQFYHLNETKSHSGVWGLKFVRLSHLLLYGLQNLPQKPTF